MRKISFTLHLVVKAARPVASRLLAAAVSLLFLEAGRANPSFQQIGNTLVMSNVNVRLEYNLNAGTTDFYWQNSKKITAFYSGVTLNTGYIKGINYSSWSYVTNGNQAVVTATGSGLPTMKQYFTLDQNDNFLVRVDVSGSNLKANWMGPVVVDTTGGVNIGITNDNRALVVPFDNDGFVRYNAMPMNNAGTSYEVGAFYDNTSRNGLVVGSVTHDTWKTGVFFVGANNKLNAMNVYGGATTPADVMPHGYVSGNTISSPTMFVGFGADWRVTMQNYAAENTNFVPRLAWTNGVPFGWNSWGVIQQYISYSDAIAVSDYFYVNLMHANFSDNGTAYINLDSFWNNLSNSQLQQFVNHVHAHGQKAGIYFGPFVIFLATNQITNTFIQGSTNTWLYSDAILKDTNGNYEMSDGGYALDPTHPGTKDMINYFINLYTNWGFDYIKMDFLSHGTFEGVHYDTNVTTGIEAYNQGMQYVLNAINGRMFISESIAPLFPYQYAHSRRISCDAQASLIANTAYVMNSVSYGWWLDNLYQFNDPDVMVFNGYGATTNENQSRLISGAVTGLFLDGDALTNSSAQSNVQQLLTNQAINNVARVGQTFTPVEGNTGTSAVNIFVRQNGATWCIAVFNYTSKTTNETVNLSRAGLPSGSYNATNLWDGTATVVTGSFNVSLNAKQSKLFQFTAVAPANLQWSASNNNRVWDTGISTNWINLANSQQTVFNTGNQVLFDDTVGVPASVTVNGAVSPGLVTVNSSTNNYTFSGSGSISGAGSLVKEGSSTLTIVSPANFTGPVTISGGTIYAGDFSFTDVSSITITNNSTWDFGGGPLTGNKPITVSGTGVNGEGALFNSSYGLFDGSGDQVLNITLAGDTTFGAASGGGSRWDLADGSTLNGPFKVTINFPGGYGEWDTVAIATNVGDLELAQGTWGLKGLGAGMGNPANTLTVDSGCELDFWNSSFGANSGYARNIHVLTNAAFKVLTSPNTFINANVTSEGGAFWQFVFGSGAQTMNGTITLNGLISLQAGNSPVVFSNVISGAGGIVSYLYGSSESLVFAASNTYSGPTIIGDGMTLVLTNNGSISGSSLIFFGGSNPANISLDASGRPDKTLTLASGQTLAGVGRINGSLVVSAGATLSPAGTNVTLGITSGTNATGTISATNAIILNGTTAIKLNGSDTNDVVQSTGAGITYGGTLNLVNISTAPLAAGNSFQIFNAAGYSGSFTNLAPTTPGIGLIWDVTQLNSGKLKVIAAPAQPAINNVTVLGSSLIFSGTNGVATSNYVVLTSTNVATPLINWTPLVTNVFDVNGAFHVTNIISSDNPQQFYRIQLQ
jgi:autotransporter-associated beta strand protein